MENMHYLVPPNEERYPLSNYVEANSLPNFPNVFDLRPVVPLNEESIRILAKVRQRELKVKEAEARIEALRSISRDHAALVSQWLATRREGERNIRIDFQSVSTDGRWFFGRSERIRATTQVSIW